MSALHDVILITCGAWDIMYRYNILLKKGQPHQERTSEGTISIIVILSVRGTSFLQVALVLVRRTVCVTD
jgi:hypothetical protein